METIIIKAAQLILALSILVIIHELGHFMPAKLFKIRVDKFYLFFDAWFSVFKFKRKDTEYGIGWIPLGGYVKLSGMIDESMDKEQMKQPPQPYEFRSKPAWQRLIVMLGGVLMNIILAFIIYIVILAIYGDTYLPTKNTKYGISCDSLALEMGLHNGDKIISVNNKIIEKFHEIPAEILLDEANTIQVLRDEQKINVPISDNIRRKLKDNRSTDFIVERFPFIVDSLIPDNPALKAGLKKDDRIIGINEKQTEFYDDFKKEVVKYKNKKVKIAIIRAATDTMKLDITITSDGLIGAYPKKVLDYNTQYYNIFEAIPAGIIMTYDKSSKYLRSLKLLFSPKTKAYESVGSFITIGNLFPPKWDWLAFWNLTAFLSIILAIMNILPIPALDGGHVLFTLYEIITGKKPGDKFLEYAQYVGMFLLLALMVFALGNDIFRLFK